MAYVRPLCVKTALICKDWVKVGVRVRVRDRLGSGIGFGSGLGLGFIAVQIKAIFLQIRAKFLHKGQLQIGPKGLTGVRKSI